MKISMWMIGEKMKKYHPEEDISDGASRITGVRFLSDLDSSVLEPQYVYLYINHSSDEHRTVLINGQDRITLHTQEVSEILNDLLSVFDFYNTWEVQLWEASVRRSIQEIVDIGTKVLANPLNVADMEGNVIAMSSIFMDEYINQYWTEIKQTRHVPTELLGSPLRTMNGHAGEWTDTPEIFLLPDGGKIIGTYLCVNGENIATLSLRQYENPINPSDKYLMEVLREVLLSIIDVEPKDPAVRSGAAIIADLLAGVQIDAELLDNLELSCKQPWRILVIDNPYRNDLVYKQNLVHRLQTAPSPCIPFIFDERVVALVSDSDAISLLDSVLGPRDRMYYQAGLSLPFENLRNAPVQYDLALYSIKGGQSDPGVYFAEAHALEYLLSSITGLLQHRNFIHPALAQLKAIDSKKNSQLYETLYQYLLHERSIQQAADAMHVHKNSFLYRLQRIRDITQLDLDDPKMRTYLLLCYLLESQS